MKPSDLISSWTSLEISWTSLIRLRFSYSETAPCSSARFVTWLDSASSVSSVLSSSKLLVVTVTWGIMSSTRWLVYCISGHRFCCNTWWWVTSCSWCGGHRHTRLVVSQAVEHEGHSFRFAVKKRRVGKIIAAYIYFSKRLGLMRVHARAVLDIRYAGLSGNVLGFP